MRTLKVLFRYIKDFYKSPRKYLVTVVLLALVIVLGVRAIDLGNLREKLVYKDSLDLVALTVNDTDLNLRQLAFYVAYEEMQVDGKAHIYDPDHPGKYWNLHIDGVFMRIAARDAAMQMAVHDEIFYQMAVEDGVELTQEQRALLENDEADFWNDLQEYDGADRMGITREDVHGTMERIAYAQNYQAIYARLQDAEYEDYDFTGEAYKAFLEECSYKVKDSVWERISFGNVILHN